MTVSALRAVGLFLVCATTAAVLAQAQQPPKDSKAAPQAAASSTSATAPSAHESAADSKAKGAQSATKVASLVTDPSAVLLRDAADAGFKLEHIRGNPMFCRTATELGSRFPVRTCYGEEQVKIKIQQYQTERSELRAHGGFPQPCNPPSNISPGLASC